jgi:adhesin transport system outer membrane protein
MGILIPTIMQDEHAVVYSNVGLDGHEPENLDALPLEYDRDKDLIVDEKDICANSQNAAFKNLYGCRENDSNVAQIERYSGFLFSDESLGGETKELLEKLILQLTPYGLKNIKFELLANAEDDSLSQEELYVLSKNRANAIKTKLLDAGAVEENILILSNADTAPMYSDNTKRNNRVDIIVKKLNK